MKRSTIIPVLCLFVLAFAGGTVFAFPQHESQDDRVANAWTSPSPAHDTRGHQAQKPEPASSDGSIEIDVSTEAAAELRAALEAPPNAGAAAEHPTDPDAQYQLALAATDPADAEYWYVLAGQQGHIGAARYLAELFSDGPSRNPERAKRWYSAPRTHYMTTGELVGGTKADLLQLQEAERAFLISERKERKVSPSSSPTAYEVGEVIGLLLKGAAASAETPSSSSPSSLPHTEDMKACRKEALHHITTCQKRTDYLNCEMGGCPDVIRCDGYAKVCEGHGAPYNTNAPFYCDKRNWRRRDEVLENVLNSACPAK